MRRLPIYISVLILILILFFSISVVGAQNDSSVYPAYQECVAALYRDYATGDMTNEEYQRRAELCQQSFYNDFSKTADSSFDSVWKLPILKAALQDRYQDFVRPLTAGQSRQLYSCLINLNNTADLDKISAETQRQIANCFSEIGYTQVADLYKKIGIVVDCGRTRFSFQTKEDLKRVLSDQTREDEAYIEKCIIKRTSPILGGLAVLNIPLAAGWQNVFLFGQLLITQPVLLLRRRKYKTQGKVFDAVTTRPVDLGLVRLVNHETNKVIRSLVTNHVGAYLFLPTPGTYRVEVEKLDYVFPSKMIARAARERYHYFGEPIQVDKKEEVIDKYIPIDPQVGSVSVFLFFWRKWKYRLALAVGLLAPLISITYFFLAPKLWVGVLMVVHVILLALFFRLGLKKKLRKFGVVSGKNSKALSLVVVSLFRKQDNKLLNYYVTDLFGRYFFPAVVGDFVLTFEKKGYEKKTVSLIVNEKQRFDGVIKANVVLEKDRNLLLYS